MRTAVSGEEVERYRREGFLLMPDFLDAAELEEWRAATERGVATRLAQDDGLSNAGFDAVELRSNLGGIFESHPEWRDLTSVPAVLPAGGAVWHNALIAHGAGANMTSRGRRAMTCAYMPDGVTYNGKRDEFVFTAEYAAALRVGRPLDDDAVNPLVGSAA